MSDDETESEEGHQKDAEEDPDDYLDRLWSRDNIWSVAIGFGITNWILHASAIVWPGIPLGNHVDWFVVWTLLTPAMVLGGMYWPDLEQRYAKYLPWMDSNLETGGN
ncbi:MAG: hypothetical protein SV760_06700 [Halobacteria archaeon]|nr:hypothetical protein [Halobacteria archaeon]